MSLKALARTGAEIKDGLGRKAAAAGRQTPGCAQPLPRTIAPRARCALPVAGSPRNKDARASQQRRAPRRRARLASHARGLQQVRCGAPSSEALRRRARRRTLRLSLQPHASGELQGLGEAAAAPPQVSGAGVGSAPTRGSTSGAQSTAPRAPCPNARRRAPLPCAPRSAAGRLPRQRWTSTSGATTSSALARATW